MKIDPLSIILNQNFEIDKKFYFVSGNEATLIEKINTLIFELLKKKEKITLTKIENISEYVEEGGLFEHKKVFLIKNSKGINEESINNIRRSSDVFLFSEENSQKNKKIKSIFAKDEDSYLIDCYELDKNSKTKLLNNFLKLSDVSLDKEVYWMLLEKLDDKYGFLENSLNKILELDNKDINNINIKKLLSISDTGKEKVFFNLFKKNRDIVETYREKIISVSDVNELYYNCKFFCLLIIGCDNESEFNRKIPAYLFKEKKFLIDFYKQYNSRKKRLLLKLLLSTEKVLRKENDLSLISGLRFLLSVKKITTS